MTIKKKLVTTFFIFVALYLVIMPLKFSYFDIYKLSLKGKIENVTISDKKRMHILVLNKNHDIAHYWPILQQKVAIGDSVYKKSGEYEIILIKKNTKEKIVCKFRENE